VQKFWGENSTQKNGDIQKASNHQQLQNIFAPIMIVPEWP